MTTYQALYYPFIHFKDDNWLKLSALYWDKIGRIKPQHYQTEDSATVKALGAFVKDFAPEIEGDAFAATFIDFVKQYAPKLQAKYALSLRDQWERLPETRRAPRPGGPSGNDSRLSYIFCQKIPDDLYTALNESELASTDARGSQWIGMHPDLAWVYMTALAEHIAERAGLRPLTDETSDHIAVSGLSIERLAQALLHETPVVGSKVTKNETEELLISVAFRAIVPTNLDNLDVDKILAFREKYPKDRAKFQRAAASFLGSRDDWLGKMRNREEITERLQDEYGKEWKPQLAELREKLREVGIDTVYGCFSLKAVLPAGLASWATALGLAVNPVVAGTAGLALGAVPIFRDKRKAARKVLAESPVSYLYRMEQDLKPVDLWGWVKQRAMKLTLDV
jgi:hypothetical protein